LVFHHWKAISGVVPLLYLTHTKPWEVPCHPLLVPAHTCSSPPGHVNPIPKWYIGQDPLGWPPAAGLTGDGGS